MRDCFSQAKSTDNRQRFGRGRTLLLIILAVISIASAACAFSLTPGSAVSYAASSDYRVEIDTGLTFERYSDKSYKVYMVFDEEPRIVDGYSNKAPKSIEVIVPAGSTSTNPYFEYCGFICDFSFSNGVTGTSIPTARSGALTTSATLSYTIPDLVEGTYTLSFKKYEECYEGGNTKAECEKKILGEETFEYTIYIDNSIPTIEPLPSFTNSGFTIEAYDEGGIYAIYVKYPGDSSYTVYEKDTVTISKDAGDGEYEIYAMNNAGNKSETVTVYLDTVAPTITYRDESDCYLVTASDESGNVHIEDDEGNVYGSIYSLTKNAIYGMYTFYAVDGAGNESSPITITHSAESLSGHFEYSDTDNSIAFFWDDPVSWTATLNGQPYECGTWITKEGSYTILLYPPSGTAIEYNFEIGHCYVVAEKVEPTCTLDGYTTYLCLQCGDEYTISGGKATGHVYEEDICLATCTQDGYRQYTCVKCGYSYREVIPRSHGHYYTYEIVLGNGCEANKRCIYTCIYCGDTYEEEIEGTADGHLYYTTDWLDPTCTEDGYKHYECVYCGNDYYTFEYAYGHSWGLSPESWYDKDTDTQYNVYTCGHCGYKITETIYEYRYGASHAATDDEGNELTVIVDKETGIVTFSYLSPSGEDLVDELVVSIRFDNNFGMIVAAPAEIDLNEYGISGDVTVTVYGRGDVELCEFWVSLSGSSFEEADVDEEIESSDAWIFFVAVVVVLIIIALVVYIVQSHNKKKERRQR